MAAQRSQFVPETDVERLAPYRVVGATGIRSLLKDLVARRSLVALYPPRSYDASAITQVVRFDDEVVDLDLVSDQRLREAVLAGGAGVVVGVVDTIKIQFDVSRPKVVDAPGGAVLRCALPSVAFRIQRRDAFRVRPLMKEPAYCRLVDPEGGESVLPVIDFSIAGLALSFAPGARAPERGDVLRDCRFEIGRQVAIRCDMVVRNVIEDTTSDHAPRRVGCEFQRLSVEAERTLQRAVMDIEQRTRALAAR